MGDVHFHIFGDDVLESVLRHPFDDGEYGLKVQAVGKTEPSFGDVERTYLSGKVVKPFEKVAVYLAQTFGRAHFDVVDVAALKQGVGVLQALFVDVVLFAAHVAVVF